ncbi:MAG: hypothetical protein A2511_17575 [Deltaproteobacteria bacterium RIFOXYD12_FULL_50_9]|nr:MAG: hypothetical protein A2511_17575 [Deltaproteobacteria bacterium RIFOXYD12_FULL_50_9]
MMKYDLSSILVSKKAYRKKLAQMPIGEKLLLIEQMRERNLTIAKSRSDLSEKLMNSPDKATKG